MPRAKKSSGKRFQTQFFGRCLDVPEAVCSLPNKKNIWKLVDFNSTRVCVPKPGFCSTDGRLFWGSKRDAKPEDAGSGAPAKPLLHTIAPSDGGLRPLG